MCNCTERLKKPKGTCLSNVKAVICLTSNTYQYYVLYSTSNISVEQKMYNLKQLHPVYESHLI